MAEAKYKGAAVLDRQIGDIAVIPLDRLPGKQFPANEIIEAAACLVTACGSLPHVQAGAGYAEAGHYPGRSFVTAPLVCRCAFVEARR